MSDETIRVMDPGSATRGWQPVIGPTATCLANYLTDAGVVPNRESADRILSEAHTVLSRCIDPSGGANRRTGLVCGFVQSGKTASMTAVAALAKDNGFRIIIMLAGTTTNLVTQNRDRLETHLRSSSSSWSLVMLTNPRGAQAATVIDGLCREWRSTVYDETDRRTLFISVMKNHRHLRHLTELLSSEDLADIPALIFDDEADQASLNTRPTESEASTTYRVIEDLRAQLPTHTYLQYTATPQAPLLITRIDALSADFAELVSAGEGYVGGAELFINNRGIVESIAASDLYADDALPIEPPASLVQALRLFFVGVAAGRIASEPSHRSMLVHPSKATATHRRYLDWVNQVKDHWHSLLVQGDPADRDDLLEDLRSAHSSLSATAQDVPGFDEIVRKLPAAINQTTVTLVNSVDGHEVPWENGYSHILVGGEKLGRGYTVKGLTVTYMPRSPGGWTADTIQQRARFFGYHSAYIGYCRVFLHPQVRNIYRSYVNHELDMRARIAEHRGRPLKEWRRLFYLDSRLRPTRSNVLSSPYLRPKLPGQWFAPRAPHMSPGDGMQNSGLLDVFGGIDWTPDAEYSQHSVATVNLREVFECVMVPWSYLYEDDVLGLCAVNCNLASLLERNPDSTCRVYLMNGGNPRVRSLRTGLIPQLFQGRSSAGSESYPGDRHFSAKDQPTLQIHVLNLEGDGASFRNVPAIAVHLHRMEDLLVHDE